MAATVRAEKSYTGTIVSVNPPDGVLTVVGPWGSARGFKIGGHCAYNFVYSRLKNDDHPMNDLRVGEKVTVTYQEREGVLTAERIEQQPMQLAGVVKRLSPDQHTLTLHRWMRNQRLDIAAACIVVLPGGRAGALADIHPGDPVVVTYETPGVRPAAWQITKVLKN